MAFLDVLLGVVPGAAAGTHRDRHEQTGNDGAHQQAAEGCRAEEQTDQDRHDHRQQRRNDHFLDGGGGQHVDRAAVFRLGRAFHDPFDFAELAANLDHHRTGCTANGFHRHRAEQIRHQTADEQADDDHVVRQIEADRLAGRLERMGVVGKEDECSQAGRSDRIALGYRLGGVANRIERVGDCANRLGHAGHLGDAAGVVGDRAVGVECNDDAGHREHRGRGDRDAVQACKIVGRDDRTADHQHRPGGRFHRDRQTRNDVGAVTGFRGSCHIAHRLVLGAGVVLGDDHQQRGQDQADHR